MGLASAMLSANIVSMSMPTIYGKAEVRSCR